MAIKAKCEKCAARFQAKDELAGKRVKCPKCGEPMRISDAPVVAIQAPAKAGVRSAPAAHQTATRRPPANFAGAAGFSARRDNPLLDLLDEAGVESMPAGPLCTHCGAEMGATAIICVECGFNMATGKQLVTDTYGNDPSIDGDLTDGQKLLARAEKEIDDSPITAVGQDFGDGADSMLIAVVALVVMGVLVGIGVGVIFLMDQISESINSAKISFFASIGIYALCAIWITIVAFLMKPLQGIVCAATAGLYCIVFGFMQGKTLLIPTIILLASIVIGLLSSFFAFETPSPY